MASDLTQRHSAPVRKIDRNGRTFTDAAREVKEASRSAWKEIKRSSDTGEYYKDADKQKQRR